MIEIYIDNSINLDLPLDLVINMVQENPLFLQDEIPSPYSFSFAIPPTNKNLSAFGMPDRITSKRITYKRIAEIRHYGYILMRGEVMLTEYEKDLKLQFVGSIIPDNVRKNLNSNEEMNSYDLGLMRWTFLDPPDYSQPYADQYVNFMSNAALTGDPFVIAPIRIEASAWEGDSDVNGFYNLIINYVNYFNAPNQLLFPFDDPTYPGYSKHCHTPVLPAVYVKDILTAMFGDKLSNSPFSTGDLSKLVIPTINHKHYSLANIYSLIRPDNIDLFLPIVESYEKVTRDDFAMIVNLNSFQQAYSGSGFLKNILKMFSMTIYAGISWSIERNDDIMDRNIVVDWSKKIVGKPKISIEKAKSYQFKYKDNTKNESVTNIQKFDNLVELFDFAINADSNVENYLEDIPTGYIYKTNKLNVDLGSDSQRMVICEIYKSPLSTDYTDSADNAYTVESEIMPLETTIDNYWIRRGPQLKKYHWHVPVMKKLSLTDAPQIMLYAGNRKTFKTYHTLPEADVDFEFPYLSNSNYDVNGEKFCDFSLSPLGEDGLIAKFHSRFKAWVEKDKIQFKAYVLLTVPEVKNLNMRDKYYIDGKLFYIEKIEYQVKHTGISLIEADLIEC